MIFSSPLFLFVFLPVVLVGYYAMPPRVKNAFLLLASLVFYAWGEPIYVALLVASIVGNYAFGLAIDRTRSAVGRRLVVTLAVLGNLAFLAYFKYFSFALVNLTLRCLGPDASAVTKGRFMSVSTVLDNSILAFSAASFNLCRAILSWLRSIP